MAPCIVFVGPVRAYLTGRQFDEAGNPVWQFSVARYDGERYAYVNVPEAAIEEARPSWLEQNKDAVAFALAAPFGYKMLVDDAAHTARQAHKARKATNG